MKTERVFGVFSIFHRVGDVITRTHYYDLERVLEDWRTLVRERKTWMRHTSPSWSKKMRHLYGCSLIHPVDGPSMPDEVYALEIWDRKFRPIDSVQVETVCKEV